MFWKLVERSTNLVFLLLAVVILSKQLSDERMSSEILAEKKVMMDVIDNRTFYLESKVNRVAESSDSYQVSVNSRISVLENRMIGLEQRTKASARIVNTNTAIANGKPVQ